jgi:peptide/nickel transport system substrate-binding protein
MYRTASRSRVEGLRSLLPIALLALTACSSESWEAPPAAASSVSLNEEEVARIVEALVVTMESGGIYELEVEHADSGLRLRLDRRKATVGVIPSAVIPALEEEAPEPIKEVKAKPAKSAVAEVTGPSEAAVDVFHPDRVDGEELTPLYGGRAIVHLASMPKHMNYVTENSAVTTRMLYEVHETLLKQDWEFHEFRPRVASGYEVEDMLVLADGAEVRYSGAKTLRVRPLGYPEPFDGYVLYGKITELSSGGYLVEPQTSGGSAIGAAIEVAAADCLSLERGCALTFKLRDDVVWHPAEGDVDGKAYSISGEKLDAGDVHFSWDLYSNAEVDCDEKRFQFEKISDCEIIDEFTLRFFYQEQHFQTVETIGTSLTLLPSHVYNLKDPQNPWFDADASSSQQANHINENPHNQLWVGVGPYRVLEWNQQFIEAKRFAEYFDESNGGYLDTIRWRYIGDDNTAWQGLMNGELDYFERVKSTDYFGAATEQDEFKSQFYKGYKYLGTYGYTGWNSHRPYLSDKRVRQALAHAFPAEEFLRTNYKNLARRVSGPSPYSSAAYDHSLEPYPYDLEKARELLEEAGYYDTDGNQIVDKDGRDLVLEFMMPSGNDASKNLGLVMQENFALVGIKLEFAALEWATFLDRMKKREFDGCNLAWVPTLESDPEQLWHSKWGAPEIEGSNNAGIQEPELDALILKGQREIDFEKRQEVWKAIHRFLYDWQPYLFGFNVPTKYALSKRLRGFQSFAIDPGYSLRRWYYVDPSEPGTRASR